MKDFFYWEFDKEFESEDAVMFYKSNLWMKSCFYGIIKLIKKEVENNIRIK